MAKIRSELESWLTKYPLNHQEELVRRFQKDDFKSAFFELFLHELMIRHGYNVTVHSQTGTKGKFPDFEIHFPNNKDTVILEATLCHDDNGDDGTANRLGQIYDSINAISCPFFIMLRDIKFKSRSHDPSSKRIASYFRELGALALHDAARKSPYEDNLVSIEFRLVPKTKEAIEDQTCCNIGTYPFKMRWGNGTKAGRRSLNSKAKHYGSLDKPFVIAVNTLGPWGYDARQHLETLFGTRQESVKAFTEELHQEILPDGLWGTEESPKYTRVSGVIFACAHPTKVVNADFRLYRNPWAAHPLPPDFWKLPTIDLCEDNALQVTETITPGELLDLPNDWPGELFPD